MSDSRLFVIRQLRRDLYWNCSSEHGTGWNPGHPKQSFSPSELTSAIRGMIDRGFMTAIEVIPLEIIPEFASTEEAVFRLPLKSYQSIHSPFTDRTEGDTSLFLKEIDRHPYVVRVVDGKIKSAVPMTSVACVEFADDVWSSPNGNSDNSHPGDMKYTAPNGQNYYKQWKPTQRREDQKPPEGKPE